MRLKILTTSAQLTWLKQTSRLVGLMLLFGLLFKPQFKLEAEPTVISNSLFYGGSRVSNPATQVLHLEIKLSSRHVTLYRGKTALKSYPIAIGRQGWETPLGIWKVMQKFRDPSWKSPFNGVIIPGGDPSNPLGHYWIGFWTDGKNWIGFHGTPNTDSVGKPASHGCIRMYNKDVQELFDRVSIGTPVTVVR